jgi:hypothetical protein
MRLAMMLHALEDFTAIGLHISYLLQNCKKGKPPKKELPLLKNDTTAALKL